MRKLAILIIGLMFAPFSCFGAESPSFENGKDESIVSLAAPNYKATVNLTIPAGYYGKLATMNVTGMAVEGNASAYPENVALSIDGTDIWRFQGIGYGKLGLQDRFSSDRMQTELRFGSEGGSLTEYIRLPRNANINSATIEVAGTGPIRGQELMNFTGEYPFDLFSRYQGLSRAGDVNKDGWEDLIIGAARNDVAGNDSGRAYLYFGGPDMDNNPDLAFNGSAEGDNFGWSVSEAGDVNNDGYDDVVIGAYLNDSGGLSRSGKVEIFFGGPDMDNVADITVIGKSNAMLGHSVACAGDVNNDSYDDVIMGGYNSAMMGEAFVIYGGANMDNLCDVGFKGVYSGDRVGWSVSGAGDVNNDGYDDVIIGALIAPATTQNGSVYVLFGGENMDGIADVTILGEGYTDNFGVTCSYAGDVNRDGYDDIIVGAPGNDAGGSEAGRAYVFYGGQNMDNVAEVVFTGSGSEDHFGTDVSNAEDLNNDGYDDVIVGAPGADTEYIFFGSKQMDNKVDVTIKDPDPGHCFGESSSSAGDLNHDGHAEVLIGAYGSDFNFSDHGKAYVYQCNNDLNPGILDAAIRIGTSTIWTGPGYFNGTVRSDDFSQPINNYLRSAMEYQEDDYGNSMVDIPLWIFAKNDGSLNLTNLTILYSFDATVPDFSSLLCGFIGKEKGKNPNGPINVAMSISSKSPGKVRLSGLTITQDLPPSQIKELNIYNMDEDTINLKLIDLYSYFRDDVDSTFDMNYSLVYASNSSVVVIGISQNRYLAANAMTGDANDNWTGTIEAIVACEDRRGQKIESNIFTILVKNQNDPPWITSVPPEMAEPGVLYQYNITAVDGDKDNLKYRLDKAPANMTFDSENAKVEWLPRLAGNYQVTAVVDDGFAMTVQDFSIYVPNRPPEITGSPSLNGTVGVFYEYDVSAQDPNLDIIDYSLIKKPDGMQIDPSTGRITWTPNAAGSFFVSVKVSDGKEKVFQNFTLDVQLTFENRAPVFKSKPLTEATVDKPYSYKATAVDSDSDLLTYSLESSPTGMSMDARTGMVTWMPTTAGNFAITIKVLDGKGGEAKQEFAINVSPAVRPQIVLTTPAAGETLKGTITLAGIVTKGTREVLQVQVRVDGGEWKDAVGNYSWGYTLNTKSLKNGKHAFEFRAYDGKEYSDVVKAEFKVDNAAGGGKGFIPMLDGIMVMALFAAIGAMLWHRRVQLAGMGD